jgi:hypothetical protein
LSKKNKAEGITLPNFKTHYKTITIKIAYYWHKIGCNNPCNKTAQSYWQRYRVPSGGKDSVLKIEVEKIPYPHAEE